MQQGAQVYFEVAGIGAQGFFRGSPAEAAGLEVAEKLLAEVSGEALELAADGGFVDVEEAGDLEQRLLVEEVGGEKEAVVGGEGFEGAGDGVGEAGEFGGDGRGGCSGRSGVEGVGILERSFAVGAAVVVDVTLGESGAQPAEEGAAAGVGGEWGIAAADALGEAEEFGVEGVGEVAAESGGSADGDGGLGEWSLVEAEEALPGGFAAKRAGLGEGEIGEAEGAVEGGLLREVCMRARGQAVVVFGADGGKGGSELFASEGAGFGAGGEEELLNESGGKAGESCVRFSDEGRGECGLGGRQREGEFAGLGGRVHDFDDTPVI